MAGSRLVNVINLGRMGFMSAYSVQKNFVRQMLDTVASGQRVHGQNVLLLVEHNPVYTIGLRDHTYTDTIASQLRTKGAEFYKTDRGGLITFHGPGQLVVYPVLNLHEFEPSMRWYVSTLEKTMIKTCKHFDLEATTTDNVGVWVQDRKIGAIGVHGSRFVTHHGIALNCNTDLAWFKHIVPCGIEGKEVTSLSKELQQPVLIKDTISAFLQSFEREFQCSFSFAYMEDSDLDLITKEQFVPQERKKISVRPQW
ncbi:putative lipoyltransferase 2, mitochondrial [Mizuhopecten yessoensis]|nr:putative lipoyltransferase 2, mitochondrial [Mizuhopecten yessoensis]